MSATSPLRTSLMTAATATTTPAIPVNIRPFQAVTVYVIGTGTISDGVLTLEEATYDFDQDGTYAGTWSAIDTVDCTSVSGGAQFAYHVGGPGGLFAFDWIRARITTAVSGGGAISAVLVATGPSS